LLPTRTVRVPVVVPTIGTLPDALELVSVGAEPDTVNLIVPEGTAGPDHVATEALDLQHITGDSEAKSPLAIPPDVRLSSTATSEVLVTVDVRTRK
jgi:hypothetical protein